MRRAARRFAASEGFTLVEVLVALAVLAIVIGAIGEVVGTTVKGIRSVDRRLPLLETAQNLLASLPERAALQPGTQTGGSGDFRWRVDVVPLAISRPPPKTGAASLLGTEPPAAQQPQWQPYAITIRVQRRATGRPFASTRCGLRAIRARKARRMSAPRQLSDPRSGEAGFTLIEMLIATMLMVFVLTALATITAQWLPNWNHGMERIERDERFASSLNRIVGDLSVAEFVTVNGAAKTPFFDGNELGVAFVRTAVGPNAHPGLEFVRFREVADANGPALVRERSTFTPMSDGAQVRYTDPVVLMRAPYRVMFSYNSPDSTWRPTWQSAAQLPTKIRITVRDGITQQRLAVSTAALVHIDTPADCVKAKNFIQCMQQLAQAAPAGNNQQAPPNSAPE